jgi:hypothetical protein
MYNQIVQLLGQLSFIFTLWENKNIMWVWERRLSKKLYNLVVQITFLNKKEKIIVPKIVQELVVQILKKKYWEKNVILFTLLNLVPIPIICFMHWSVLSSTVENSLLPHNIPILPLIQKFEMRFPKFS